MACTQAAWTGLLRRTARVQAAPRSRGRRRRTPSAAGRGPSSGPGLPGCEAAKQADALHHSRHCSSPPGGEDSGAGEDLSTATSTTNTRQAWPALCVAGEHLGRSGQQRCRVSPACRRRPSVSLTAASLHALTGWIDEMPCQSKHVELRRLEDCEQPRLTALA